MTWATSASPRWCPATTPSACQVQGFRPLERKNNVVLAAGRLAVGTLQLEVGSVTESVLVTAQGAGVATSTTATSDVIDSKQVSMISLRGRDPISILRILPGVQQGVDQDTFGGSFSTPVPAFLGSTARNTIYVDGVNGGDGGNGGGGGANFSGATNLDASPKSTSKWPATRPSTDSKAGRRSIWSPSTAAISFTAPATGTSGTKCSTPNSFFNNKLGVTKPVYRYSTLGANIGGPVKTQNSNHQLGRPQVFLLLLDRRHADQVRQPAPHLSNATALERSGDFSQTVTTAGA